MLDRIRHYLSLHAQNLLGSFGRLARQPVGSAMTIVVIAIALALPAGLRVLLNNFENLSGSWAGAIDFSIYLDMEVSDDRARELARELESRPDITQVLLVPRDEALTEFKSYSGFGSALDALEDNPLPHALVVRPSGDSREQIQALADALAALPETDLVQVDTAWVERLRAILLLIGRSIDLATVLLGLAVVLVIGNTIRLEINNRRTEIEVVKLVGGSDAFIRRPFLYMGLCYGLSGSVLAMLTIMLSLLTLAGPVRALAGLYGSSFALRGLSGEQALILIATGSLLGWAGAGLATARHLRSIEPS
ncbi:MAG TPA: permease-like cell division protein FtsX [Gammaproteobacteria bacterium]|nr:permease-like cell division protein FtsX [Gammaproteobacteria bacterium]